MTIPITLTGPPAITVALAANLTVKVYRDGRWERAPIMQARALAARGPDRVRLTGDAQAIAGKVVGRRKPLAATDLIDLYDQLVRLQGAVPEPSVAEALRLINDALRESA